MAAARFGVLQTLRAHDRNLWTSNWYQPSPVSWFSNLRSCVCNVSWFLSLVVNSCGLEFCICCNCRYFTITGEKPDEDIIEKIIETGESENFLQVAIHEQGRGQILETIREIQERHDTVKEIEKNLLELHQIFLDMAVLVEAQGEQLNDIESQVTINAPFKTILIFLDIHQLLKVITEIELLCRIKVKLLVLSLAGK